MIKRIANSIIISNSSNILGEGLYVSSNGIFWVDIAQKKLFVSYSKKEPREFELPEHASAIWKVTNSLVYLVSVSGMCTFDISTGCWNVLAEIPNKKAKLMRANDGVEASEECYFFGTMEFKPTGRNGSLYIYNGKNIIKIYSGIGIPNSFVKVDKHTFLITDSYEAVIYRFTLNKEYNAIVKKETWLDLSGSGATPDGGCSDADGNIYLSMWDGSCVNKYDKNANLLSIFELPVKRPTNCKLSLNRKSLIVTTAREGLSEDELAISPESGSLFQIGLQ